MLTSVPDHPAHGGLAGEGNSCNDDRDEPSSGRHTEDGPETESDDAHSESR
jgi:hypothetical protein